MAKRRFSAKRNAPSPIVELFAFVEQHKDQYLERPQFDRLCDLDFAAGAECKQLGIAVPDPAGKRCMVYMKLPYEEKSIYDYPGNVSLGGEGNLPDFFPVRMDPDERWLNWIRTIIRQLSQPTQEKVTHRRAEIAVKIERLTRELKEHLIAARDFAYATKDETGTPELLPRPSQKELARRLKLKPYDITRCLQDDDATELKLYWDTAADIHRILRFSAI